jgi:RNA polymerase sigma-B factor
MERELVGHDSESSATERLLRKYHERGDTTARKQLVELYLPLVDSLVRRHTYTGGDYDDLFQVGCIGLINAIDRFDPERGAELAAFAVPNIAGEIQRYLRDRAATVRLPRRVLELRGPAGRAEADLSARLGRTPTTAEIATELGADERDAALALDAARASSALELEPGAEPAEHGDIAHDRLFLAEAFRELDERERRIVYLRYMHDLPPAQVARALGLSERQLSRTTQVALGKLRTTLEGKAASADGQGPAAPAKRLPRRRSSEPKMAAMGRATGAAATEQDVTGYHIELVRDAESGWIAQIEELAGCEGHGMTADEAVRDAEAAMERWVADAAAANRDVPKPRAPVSHSGRLMVRMPPSLHAELARAAQREDVSLNQFISGVLASAVHWRSAGGPGAPAAAPDEPQPKLRPLLVVNLIVLAIVAVVALILLVVALT